MGDVAPSRADEARGRDERVFAGLLVLYLVVLYPILRADRYYSDDLKRALIGRTGWDSNGRPLTTLLMKLLQCYDHALVDISPLTQIGGVALLALAGVLIARRFEIRSPTTAVLVAFPLGAQPFFLENLSYKFDALSMCLALLLAVLPFALPRDLRGRLWGGLALFASLSLYQPAIDVALVFLIVEVIVGEIERFPPRVLLREAGSRLLQLVAAMAVYEALVGIHVNGWVRHRSEMIHVGVASHVIANLAGFAAFVGGSFGLQWWRYFGTLLGVLALVATLAGLDYARRTVRAGSRKTGAAFGAAACLVPFLAPIAAAGPMLALEHPLYSPRVMLGVGALLAGALLVCERTLRRWRRSTHWTRGAGAMLAIGLCVIASAYGNALGEQTAYENRIAARLADDLASLGDERPIDTIVLTGNAGYAPYAAHVAETLPLVRALVVPYLAGDNRFVTGRFLAFFIPDLARMHLRSEDASAERQTSALLSATCHRIPAARTNAYRLYRVADAAVVRFGIGPSDDCTNAVADGAEAPGAQLWSRIPDGPVLAHSALP
jgi:Glucosyl transferase GtrII